MPDETDALEAVTDAFTAVEMFKAMLGDIANPIAVIKAILWLGDRNNATAAADFREAMDELNVLNAQQVQDVTKRTDAHERRLDEMDQFQERVLEMVLRPEEWKGREHEKPPWGDVVTRAQQFNRDAWGAGSHGKRKILLNAFFNSFKPEFYTQGWSNHLWKIVEQIEYPECQWLAERIKEEDARAERKKNPSTSDYNDRLPGYAPNNEAHFLVQALEKMGLVFTQKDAHILQPHVTAVGRRFREFVKDDDRWEEGPAAPERLTSGPSADSC